MAAGWPLPRYHGERRVPALNPVSRRELVRRKPSKIRSTSDSRLTADPQRDYILYDSQYALSSFFHVPLAGRRHTVSSFRSASELPSCNGDSTVADWRRG